MQHGWARHLKAFWHDRRGNVAILTGLSIIPLTIAVGVAVDYGRALLVRERMNEALDAAALAVGSWTDLPQDQLTAKAQQFFNANYPSTMIGSVGNVTAVPNGEDITVSVSATVPTTFMRMADIDHMDVSASSTITRKQRSIELVLVLDTTGSMGQTLGGHQTKIAALKSAATQLVETLFEGQSSSDTLKIGVVPFAAAVNVGTDFQYLDTTTYSASNAQSDPVAFEDLDDFSKKTGMNVLKLFKGNSTGLSNRSWTGCVRERAAPYDLTDDAPGGGSTSWAPYFAPDEPDTPSSFANDYLSDGSYTTAKCVVTTCPNCTNQDKTNQVDLRQCSTGKYAGKSVFSTSVGPDYNCPPASITPMTNTKSTVETAINALQAKGSTVIPEGLVWGWRVISPGTPFTEGAAYDDDHWIKAIVLLTDGENDVSQGSNDFDKSTYTAFGYAKDGHMGNKNGSNTEDTLDDDTTTVCNSIKNLNIRLYTIGLGVTTHSQNLLQGCATEQDMYYNAPSSDQLAGIFSDIAQGLSDLRVAK